MACEEPAKATYSANTWTILDGSHLRLLEHKKNIENYTNFGTI